MLCLFDTYDVCMLSWGCVESSASSEDKLFRDRPLSPVLKSVSVCMYTRKSVYVSGQRYDMMCMRLSTRYISTHTWVQSQCLLQWRAYGSVFSVNRNDKYHTTYCVLSKEGGWDWVIDVDSIYGIPFSTSGFFFTIDIEVVCIIDLELKLDSCDEAWKWKYV